MPTEPPHPWLARAAARFGEPPGLLSSVSGAGVGVSRAGGAHGAVWAALRLIAPVLWCVLGGCSEGSPVLHSTSPSGPPPAADGGIVVHGAAPGPPSSDAGRGSETSPGGDVTGSTEPAGGRTQAGDAASRGTRGDGGALSASSDASLPEPAADASSPGAPPTGDARTSTPTAQDAAVVDAGTPLVPPTAGSGWAAPLLGRYASRTFSFNQDDFGTVSRAEQLAIMEFVSDGDAVVLHTELCLSTVENALSRLRLLDPTDLPVRSEQVRYSEIEHSWSTEGPTFAIGYTREPPLACVGQEGKDVPKLAEQAWLTSTCRCSTVVDDLKVDDCRVIDPDHDKQPGLSYALVVKATGTTTTYYAAMASNSHFVNGQIATDGGVPSATVKADEQPYQFGCLPAGCINIASLGKACPSSFSRVSFVRLAASDMASCADIVVRSSALFPDSAPSYPARCF